MSYLIHYNKNHSSKNGRFTSGDGDGDGIANDHRNQTKNKKGMTTSGSGAINVDEDDEEEETENKGVTSKYTFKELVRRQNEKNKKKKTRSKGKKSTKKKKVKTKVVKDIITAASNKSVSETEENTNKYTPNIEDVINSYDENPVSDLQRLLGK